MDEVAIGLAQRLIRCPSVTPEDKGALDVLEAELDGLGFHCRRLPFAAPGTAPVDNLFATFGVTGRHLLFAGHSDVVPVGNRQEWTTDPFGGVIEAGQLYGRGAADMKGAIACFVAAAGAVLGDLQSGRLSLLITGDEEGPAVNGTAPCMAMLAAEGIRFDFCLVGEPTNPMRLGEMIKIGRRGSANARLTMRGIQGHSAYPHLARNAAHDLINLCSRLLELKLDEGTDHFEPSNLQITALETASNATNIIPGEASALANIRFNDRHKAHTLEELIRREIAAQGGHCTLQFSASGEAFLTAPNAEIDLLRDAVVRCTGLTPVYSTSGGTSDARFIKNYCPVAEFGLVGQTMHKIDEHVAIADLVQLTEIYRAFLTDFFERP
ncbi:MAG TPA: succinyl-diaminopimelate desuccinylase [Dongiaceae bacterium]|jgi:succinyl-diaminopimelate desuccinylase|nr:succinyl-diaminopimelate desuccinylase [Dongiaceae bacterium]